MKTIPFLRVLAVLTASALLTLDAFAAPEIQVLWNTTEIVDGDSTPSLADHTFFGVQTVGAGSITQTFTIKNLGPQIFDILSLTGTPLVSIGGANPGNFVVTVQPASALSSGGASTTFQVTWTPTFGGIHNATLTIPNNDSNENPYNFAIQATAQLKLTYDAGPNGSISGTTPQIVYSNTSGTAVTAVPNANYHFVNWTDGSTANPRTDTPVTANVLVKANFAINTYTLNYAAGANGTLTGNTSQTVNSGSNGSGVTAVPAGGYHFVNWSDASTANPRIDTNVTANRSVTANFALSNYALSYTTGTEVPLSAAVFNATGWTVEFALNYAPQPGTQLMVVANTGLAFIQGTFVNLSHGQVVNLSYAGVTYPFVANYYGGTGNDLVLVWQETRPMAWGYNSHGQVGDSSASERPFPVAVNRAGVLAGKTVLALASGTEHSLALCSDGTLAAWGYNFPGQLGYGLSISESLIPVAVNRTGVLAGRTVVAISAGGDHCLALCSDGSLAAWGRNGNGQLGNNSTDSAYVPILVDRTGVLLNKTVVAISAGSRHSLALCSDGTMAAWGNNFLGQLGNNSHTQSLVPVTVSLSNAFEGKTMVAISAGKQHSLAVASDGTVAAWGDNSGGQLGDNSTTPSPLMVEVNRAGALNGKTVVAVSASDFNSLALCSDGTLRSWGYNPEGQLGDNNAPNISLVPVAVNQSGLLAGKSVVAIVMSGNHSMARCSDGTLAVWGKNGNGQLGNNSYSFSSVPVEPYRSGVLGSARVTGIAAGSGHSLVFAAGFPDIAVAQAGALTDAGPGVSFGNVAVDGSAPLTFTITNPASAPLNSLSVIKDGANAADFTVSALSGTSIPVGSGTVTFTVTFSPSAVGSRAAALHITNNVYGDKNPFDIALSGSAHYLLSYTAGTGGSITGATSQAVGQGANGTPVTAVSATGYHFVNWSDSSTANPRTDTNVTGNVSVTANFAIYTYTLNYAAGANGSLTGATAQTVDYGTSGSAVTAVPAANYHFVNWSDGSTQNPRTDTNVTANRSVTANFSNTYALNYAAGANGTLTGFTSQAVSPNTDGTAVTAVPIAGYHFVNWSDLSTANPRTDTNVTANLNVTANFEINGYTLNYTAGANGSVNGYTGITQALAHGDDGDIITAEPVTGYHFVNWSDGSTANPRSDTNVTANVSVTANFAIGGYTLTYTAGDNGTMVGTTPQTVDHGASGSAVTAMPATDYQFVNWSDGSTANPRTDTNISANLSVTANFASIISDMISYSTGTEIPLSARSFDATGRTVAFTLNYAPLPGTQLMVVENTDLNFIQGTFDNLPNGAPVDLNYGGITYHFVAWYYGGDGNDLVLLWSDTNLAAWGNNIGGRLGDNSNTQRNAPVAVTQSGVLAGKTVVALSAGGAHSLALCSDGSLAAWGNNLTGQLGDNSFNTSGVPVAVTQSGVLAGKLVVAIVSGNSHNLALCSDGSLAAWGDNLAGQLGNNSFTTSSVPVAVTQSGVLAGKTIVAIASGRFHSLALCSDGFLAAWGDNDFGQLGDNSTSPSSVPVAVNQNGVLVDKSVVAIAGGSSHNLALCADGTLAAWGYNADGELGNNSTAPSSIPVDVTQSGVLAGKTIVTLSAGAYHNLALCSDGSLATWGNNVYGQLGDNTTTPSSVPVDVTQSGVLAGNTIVKLAGPAPMAQHSLAVYGPNTYMLSYAAGSNGALAGTTPQTVDYGANGTTVTAVPDSNYHFVSWSDGIMANPRTDTSVAADVNATANFEIGGYTLSYAAGDNGTLSGTTSQTVDHDTSGTAVTAMPDIGYHFVDWSNGSTANPRSDTNVMADLSVTANFALNAYTLTYTAGANGSLTDTNPQTVNHGADGTLVTAVPATGYHFVNWSDASTDNPRTDTNVMGDLSVTANFVVDAPVLYNITPGNGPTAGGTSVTISGNNLTEASAVTFGGTTATILDNTPTSITVISPQHIGGAVDVVVATPGGDSNAMVFSYNGPQFDGISPDNGPMSGSTSVTISGTNLIGASSVTFGGIAATIVANTDTSITVTSPAHAAGSVSVVVTTPGGSSNTKLFTYNTALETWRKAWFGSTATNTGNAADSADPYQTGIPNLLVFAFLGPDQDPASALISQLPQTDIAAPGTFSYSFTEPTGVSGITYGAEWSAMLGNDWQTVADTGTPPEHIFSVPVDGNRKFLRLSVQ